jgi:magnesium and cobalt transporter
MNDQPADSSPPPKRGVFASLFNHLFREEPKDRNDLIELIRNSEQNDLIDDDTRDMLEGVMAIAELRVRDIMIPRSQIVALKRQQSLEQCLDVIIESAHSRFPVLSEDKAHIEGLLIAKDLLPYIRRDAKPFALEQLLRPAVVVPESKRVERMLKEFRCQRYHLAIVVDEFGSISGLVTIEDILEQIVGDIADEYDDNANESVIRQLNDHTFSVPALTPIEDFNEAFNAHYPTQEVDTIGGLVMQAFGHLPTLGETISIANFHFKVTRADSRHIIQLQVTRPCAKKNNKGKKHST